MPDDLMQAWAEYVQRVTDNLHTQLQGRAQYTEQFLSSGQEASAEIGDPVSNLGTWQEWTNYFDNAIQATRNQLYGMRDAAANGRDAIQSALEQAERWPLHPGDPGMMVT